MSAFIMLTIAECWAFLETQPGVAALPAGVSDRALQQAEAEMQLTLPDDLRQFLLRHDGSGPYFISPYKIGGGQQTFMSLNRIVALWRLMVEIGADFEKHGEFGEQVGPVKKNQWNQRWIPFAENGCGDNLFLDLDPPAGGTLGQVVDWWHERGLSTFQSPGLLEWLNEVVAEIKCGVYQFSRI